MNETTITKKIKKISLPVCTAAPWEKIFLNKFTIEIGIWCCYRCEVKIAPTYKHLFSQPMWDSLTHIPILSTIGLGA